MSVINTDGLSILGPGSEWLWALLQFVALAITGLAIYRQLRVARSVSETAQLETLRDRFGSPSMRLARLETAIALRYGERDDVLPDFFPGYIASFFERLGGLVRRGHLDVAEVHLAFGFEVQFWWAACEPAVRRLRGEWGSQSYWTEWEALATSMRDLDRKRNDRLFDPTRLEFELDDTIRRARSALEFDARVEARVIPNAPRRRSGNPSVASAK